MIACPLNTLFSVKFLKSVCCLEESSISNDLNWKKLKIKIHSCAFLQDFLDFFRYNARMPLFSRVNSLQRIVLFNFHVFRLFRHAA